MCSSMSCEWGLLNETMSPDHSSCTFRMTLDGGNFMVGVTEMAYPELCTRHTFLQHSMYWLL